MGLNWLSALVLLSGITPKLLVFGEGKRRGLTCLMALFSLKQTHIHMTHYTSCNSATGVLSVCEEQRRCRGVCVIKQSCPCLKTCNQRGCCWHHSYNRSKYTSLPWCGAPSLAFWSKQLRYAHHPSRWNSFRRIVCASHPQLHTGLKLPHPAPKEEDALYCCRLFLHLTCQSRGRKRLPAGPRGALLVFHVWGTNWWWAHMSCMYIFTHAHEACSETRCASHHQWHKPSAAVFRLHWALLMLCVPLQWCALSFPSPYDCSSLLFESFTPQFMHTRHVSPLYLHAKENVM